VFNLGALIIPYLLMGETGIRRSVLLASKLLRGCDESDEMLSDEIGCQIYRPAGAQKSRTYILYINNELNCGYIGVNSPSSLCP